jgi:hypothetical protein
LPGYRAQTIPVYREQQIENNWQPENSGWYRDAYSTGATQLGDVKTPEASVTHILVSKFSRASFGMRKCRWLKDYITSRKVEDSSSDEVDAFFFSPQFTNPFGGLLGL